MQRHDACSRGKGGQGLDPHRVWGVPSSARRPPVGGCGSPPRWRRQPVKKKRGCGGEEGHGVHAGGGGAVGRLAGARARGRGCGVLSRERHRSADRGRGAAGAGKSAGEPGAPAALGATVSGGARTPLGEEESRRASSTGANPGGGGGKRHAVPSRPNRTGTGPAEWIPGGRAGLSSGAPGPGSLVAVGRRGGDRAGLWAAAGEGGARKGRAGSGANRERPPGAGRGLLRAAVP